MNKLIIHRSKSGGVTTILPSRNFVNRLKSDGLTENEALQVIAERDVRVLALETGTVGGETISSGDFIKRSDAIEAGVSFEETPYEIIDQADLPDRSNRDKIWGWV